jgi:hypothetical protein
MSSTLEFQLTTRRNIGANSKLNKLPKLFKYMIIVPDSFELAAADWLTATALKTALNTAIKAAVASRVYLFPPIIKCEEKSQDTTYDDSPLSIEDVYDGQYRFLLHFSKNMFTVKDLASHYYKNEGRAIMVDLENKIYLTEKSNGKLTGASIALLKPEKLDISDGSNSSTSPIYLCLADPSDWNARGRLLDGSSVIRELTPLVDVSITLADGDAFDAAGFKVNVKVESDGTPVSGLVVADFIKLIADGVTTEAILSAAENANVPGEYNIIPTVTFADGTLKLRAASTLTVSAYENPTRLQLAVDIP